MKPFLILFAALALAGSGFTPAGAQQAAPSPGITGVYFDVARIQHALNTTGDTWDWAWAEDDNLYTFADDAVGYPPNKDPRNMIFNRLTGSTWDALTGASVNPMPDYGHSSQYFANGSNWKSTGCECIDGVLYAFIANNWYGGNPAYGIGPPDPYLRQTVLNMSLIKSTDHGASWTRGERENYDHPMWTSLKFSTAYFFKYGQNGGSSTQDGQDQYVYAISNDGYWNDGTNLYLGRVPRAKIGDLDPADWQYDANGQWVNDPDAATPIPGFPNGQAKCNSGSPLWLAPIRKYVTVTWYNPQRPDTRTWDHPIDRIFDVYQADHPWGPWSMVGEKKCSDFLTDPANDNSGRWYGPSLSAKFVTQNPDHSVTGIMAFSGTSYEPEEGLYKHNWMPLTFYVTPQPRLLQWQNDNDNSILYSPGWTYEPHYGRGDYHDDEHRSIVPGATAEFAFEGSGVEVMSSKFHDQGEIEVVLDGVSQGRFDQHQDPFPRLYNVPIYRNLNLVFGKHRLRIVNRAPAGTVVNLDGYRTYADRPLPTTPPMSSPLQAEAENGIYGSASVYQDKAASGGAAVEHLDLQPASGVRFLHVPAGGALTIRYCTNYDKARLTLYINGAPAQKIEFPNTGDWSGHYATITVPVSIPAGAELKLQCDPGDVAVNLDGIAVE